MQDFLEKENPTHRCRDKITLNKIVYKEICLEEELGVNLSPTSPTLSSLSEEVSLKQNTCKSEVDQSIDQWESMYKEFEDFVEKYGHAYPHTNKAKYVNLRDWLIRQTFSKSILSAVQVDRLEMLNIDWHMTTNSEYRWEEMYAKLREYYNIYGHCKVPQGWSKDKQLANWITVQRRVYNRGKLKKHRERLLSEINFIWQISKEFDAQWEIYFNQLRSFYIENGHCKVPWKHQKLARWVERQRICKKKKILPPLREKRLNEIEFIWSFKYIKAFKWEEMYQLIVEFKNLHGHTFVPVQYKDNPKLGIWVSTQRQLESKNWLEQEKRNKLNELGFIWSSGTKNIINKDYESTWDINLKKLKIYKQHNGTCQVSLNKDAKLQRWTSLQRNLFYQNKLSKRRIEKLDSIGFPWNIQDYYWLRMYKALKDYYVEYGHTKVPYLWRHNPPLADWVYRLKKNKSLLAANQIKQLDNIKFDWALQRRIAITWEEHYNSLKKYKQEYGHTHVPVQWKENPKLGRWVSRMRYEKNDLSLIRKNALDAIGFEWRSRIRM